MTFFVSILCECFKFFKTFSLFLTFADKCFHACPCVSGTPINMCIVQSRTCLAQVSLPRTKTLTAMSWSRTPHKTRFVEVFRLYFSLKACVLHYSVIHEAILSSQYQLLNFTKNWSWYFHSKNNCDIQYGHYWWLNCEMVVCIFRLKAGVDGSQTFVTFNHDRHSWKVNIWSFDHTWQWKL